MGKSRSPTSGGMKSNGMKSNGTQASRGITAYRKTMGEIPADENTESLPPKPDRKPMEKPKRKAPSGEGLLKTTLPPLAGKPSASKLKRAAQFMVLVGSDEASKILSRLEPELVEAISKEIVSIKTIEPEEAEAVLEEFRSLISPSYGYSGSSSGGAEEARRILYAAFGPEKGEAILVKAVPDAAENPFDFLKDFSGEQLALLFRDESPAACAMVFSRLPSKLSAAALANTNPDRKLEIVRRIAKLKDVSPDVIDQTAAALRDKARYFGQKRGEAGMEIDGRGVLTAILKHSDVAFGDRLLDELDEDDPSLSREIKDRLYTLEDVVNAADRPIQDKLRTMDDRDIALLLRGRSEAFTQKIFNNLSSGRVDRVKEESGIMGPVPKIEIEAAAREFIAWFRLNREEGRILMLSDEDVYI